MTKINSNCDKTQKLKLWQTSKTQIVTVVRVTLVTVAVVTVVIVTSFSKSHLTPWQPMTCSQGNFLQFSQCLFSFRFATKKNLNFFLNFFYLQIYFVFSFSLPKIYVTFIFIPYFHQFGPVVRVALEVAMSVCPWFCAIKKNPLPEVKKSSNQKRKDNLAWAQGEQCFVGF